MGRSGKNIPGGHQVYFREIPFYFQISVEAFQYISIILMVKNVKFFFWGGHVSPRASY